MKLSEHARDELRLGTMHFRRWWRAGVLAILVASFAWMMWGIVTMPNNGIHGGGQWIASVAFVFVACAVFSAIAGAMVGLLRLVFHLAGAWILVALAAWGGAFALLFQVMTPKAIGAASLAKHVPVGGSHDYLGGALFFAVGLGSVLLAWIALILLSAVLATLFSAPILAFGIGRRFRDRARARAGS